MTVSRYKLAGNTTAYSTGSRTLGATGFSSYPSTPTPPTGLATCALADTGVRLEDATYINPNAGSGSWADFYFYKSASTPVTLGTFAAAYWSWAGDALSITASGGVGWHDAATSVPAYSSLYTSPARTSDGVIPDGAWHRVRLEWPSSGTGTARFFLGSNRHGTTADVTLTGLYDFTDFGTFNGQAVYWAYLNASSGASTWVSDLAYGLYGDTPPARSATDWAAVTASASASETASATAAAAAVRSSAGASSVTASASAVAGRLVLSDSGSSISVTGAADAAVITTHNAEAAAIATVAATDAMSMVRSIAGASTITLSAVGAAALDGGADAVVYASAAAGIRIEGETSPGFLYSTVNKNALTS